MTVTTNWSIIDSTQSAAQGFRLNIAWQCQAQSDRSQEAAVQSGNVDVNSTPTELSYEKADKTVVTEGSNPDFVAYGNLTDAQMLSWVYSSLIEGDETAEEAKSRVEAALTASVVDQQGGG
jgi:hypothetical protein